MVSCLRVELSLVLCSGSLLLLLGGRGLRRRDLPRLFVDSQPGTALLQLQAVSGVTYGIDEWVYARHQFAGAGRDHRGSWCKQTLIPECPDQRHYAVGRPRHEEQEANGDSRLRNPYLRRLLALVHIGAQRLHVHFLGLLP